MKGLVISCMVALEANSIPTLTFSLSSFLEDRGQSEEFCGSSGAVEVGRIRSVDPAVVLVPDDLTVLSYKDTMLLKAPGGPCWDVLFFNATSVDSSRLYR